MLEILAPCGSAESLDAALNTGVDAVYLGMKTFSARKNASNFSFEELCAAVEKSHMQGVKVYIALNTLFFDDDTEELKKAIRQADKSGADAVIVQDLGTAQLVKQIAPRLKLHASTQMTVNSVSGAVFAKQNGFSRVVLPRELSYEEIINITSNVDIETEVFVHGALCVCLSGQCLLSAVIGGRSGNRGLCAQPCRLDYICGNRQNVLSLKDLSLIDELKKLETAGVTSAKIEGRMKRPEYVAAAVSQCRAALKAEPTDTGLLRSVFSRSGFTKAYFDGSFNNMQGIRSKEDAEGSAEAMSKLRGLYRTPYKRFKADMQIEIIAERPISCLITCGELQATVTGVTPQPALTRPVTVTEITDRMSKLGGTVFTAGKITCRVDDGISVPVSAVNDLRRKAIDAISHLIADKTSAK